MLQVLIMLYYFYAVEVAVVENVDVSLIAVLVSLIAVLV